MSFDGSSYTIRSVEEDGEYLRDYKYLMKYEGDAPTYTASYKSYTRYVLTDDDTVTWNDIFAGALSSQFGDHIDHYTVYTNYIY